MRHTLGGGGTKEKNKIVKINPNISVFIIKVNTLFQFKDNGSQTGLKKITTMIDCL